MTRPETEYTPEERRLLLAAVPPAPLSEQRLKTTLQRAQHLRDAEGPWRRHRRPLLVAAAVLVAALGAAGAWRWDGHHSDRDLTLAKAIRVVDNPADHDVEGVRAALGKIRRDLVTTLKRMHATGSLPPELRQRLLDTIDHTPPSSARYSGPFELLKERAATSPLSLDEQDLVADAVRAGVAALKQGAEVDSRHRETVDLMLLRMRQFVAAPDEGK